MNKQALTDLPLSPDEAYMASQLFGKSLFSAIQLAKEQESRKRLDSAYPETDKNILRIPIPQSMMPNQQHKQAAYSDNDSQDPGVLARALKLNNHPVRMIVGGQTGFRDAKKDYYMNERKRIDAELSHAQKQYIDLLSQIKTGSEETFDNTPNVDAFCNGIAHAALFSKEANQHDDVDISDGSLKRLAGGVFNTAKRPFQPAIDTAASGLLGTAAGTAYLTYILRKKMREEPESYLQEELPTRVELEPYH